MFNHSSHLAPMIPLDVTHNESGFCYDTSHECHEDEVSHEDLQDAINNGLVTTQDADNIKNGRTV
jgi:hypothetical protein